VVQGDIESDMILSMHQPNFLPWIGYFHKMAHSDVFVLLDVAQIPRGRSYATRTKIKTPQGAKWLTLPVKRRGLVAYNEQPLQPIDRWLPTMLETLRHNYTKAKYWDYGNFTDTFKEVADYSWTLAQLNTGLIAWAMGVLEIETEIKFQSDLPARPNKTVAPVYFCKSFDCDTYLSGNGARDYNSLVVFETFNVEITYQEFQCPTYSQLWQTFKPNLSILDLLFNLGPTAKEIVHS
jgi:hypothetical protein